MSTQCTHAQKALCNNTIMIRHAITQVAEKTWPRMARRRPNRTDVGPASAQNNSPPGHAISTIKCPLKTPLWLLYNDLYIKYKPKLVQYQNDIKSLPKFTPDGVTALWYRSRKFISNVLVNKVPRIREIIGLSTKFGKNRSKTKYPIFTCTYRRMRPPALEPVTLTAFIPLRYAYRSMPYKRLSTGTNKHNSEYQ